MHSRIAATIAFVILTIGFAAVVAGLAWNAVAFGLAARYGVLDSFRAHPPGADPQLIVLGALAIVGGANAMRLARR